MNTLKVFCGGGNPELTKKICEKLDIKPSKITLGYFADGERSISDLENVRGCDVYIIQPTQPPAENIWTLLLIADAVKRSSAKSITAVIPYFGYSRQDRQDKYRSPISAKVVVKVIESAGIDRVVTMDLHTPQLQGFFDIPVEPLNSRPVLFSELYKKSTEYEDNLVLCAPDIGSIKLVRDCAYFIDRHYVWIDKRRGVGNKPELMSLNGNVEDAHVCIIDDMIDTGGTMILATKALKEYGTLTVEIMATHGLLSRGIEKLLEAGVNDITVTNTLPSKIINPSMHYLDISDLLAEAIRRLHKNESLRPLSM